MKTASSRVYQWLRANLGPKCLAPLTSQDAAALRASVEIAELYSLSRGIHAAVAWGNVVTLMQPHTRHLAFHAIAMVMDWSDREPLWIRSGMIWPVPETKCKFEG